MVESMIGCVQVDLNPHFVPIATEYLKWKSDIRSVELRIVWRAENEMLMQWHRSAGQWALLTHNSHTSETHNAYINSTHSINANVFSKVRLQATESKVTSFVLSSKNSEMVPKIQYSNGRYSCSLPHFEFSSPSLYCGFRHTLALIMSPKMITYVFMP
jgi:hypothetical protein